MNTNWKKRILLCSFSFYPARNGVANAVFKAAKGLAMKEYEIIVATSKPVLGLGETRNYEYLKNIGIDIYEFDIKKLRHRKYSGEIEKYQSFLKQTESDVIISYGFPNWNSDLLLEKCNLIDTKIVLYSRGFSGNIFYSAKHVKSWCVWRPYTWNLLPVLKKADHLIFLRDQPDKDRFYDLHLAKKNGLDYSVIGNGSDLVDLGIESNDFRDKYNIKTKHLILNVSGYNYMKNPFGSLKAFYESGVQDTTLVISGIKKGEYGKEMQRYIHSKGVKNVVLLEDPERKDLLKAYLASDLFLCTSKTESYGQVVLDAIASRVPFISTLTIMNGFRGGIVVRNTSEMAKQINVLINDDKSLKRLKSELTQEYLDTFRWSAVIDKYEKLISLLSPF